MRKEQTQAKFLRGKMSHVKAECKFLGSLLNADINEGFYAYCVGGRRMCYRALVK